MHRRRYRKNPVSPEMKWGLLILGGVAAAGTLAYVATRPAAAAPAKGGGGNQQPPPGVLIRCPDGTMQTDCTGHQGIPSIQRCPDGTYQTDCTGHMTPVAAWKAFDFSQSPPPTITAGKTYRFSFTGSIGGPEMVALQAFLQQQGLTVWTAQPPADWPDQADAADPTRVKVEGVAFASGAPPLGIVPTLKVWEKQ